MTGGRRGLVVRFVWFVMLWFAGVLAVAAVGILVRSILA